MRFIGGRFDPRAALQRSRARFQHRALGGAQGPNSLFDDQMKRYKAGMRRLEQYNQRVREHLKAEEERRRQENG